MKPNSLHLPSFTRLAISESLIITLITLLCLPLTGFAKPGFVKPGETVSPRRIITTPLAGLIVVNASNDFDNLDPNAGCDTDAVTPGEQCSFRAAIQRANALAGDDEINFNIPSTQPNC